MAAIVSLILGSLMSASLLVMTYRHHAERQGRAFVPVPVRARVYRR